MGEREIIRQFFEDEEVWQSFCTFLDEKLEICPEEAERILRTGLSVEEKK